MFFFSFCKRYPGCHNLLGGGQCRKNREKHFTLAIHLSCIAVFFLKLNLILIHLTNQAKLICVYYINLDKANKLIFFNGIMENRIYR